MMGITNGFEDRTILPVLVDELGRLLFRRNESRDPHFAR